MKSKISLLFAMGFFGLTATGLHAQVAINNSAANPDASAILDLKTGNAGVNKGFLPQAVSLTNVATAAPVTSPATGLIVYSSTPPTGGNGVGYYYWTGSAWSPMGGAAGVSGTGVANEVAFWISPTTLYSDTDLYYNTTGHWLGIGTSHPRAPLQVNERNLYTTGILGDVQPVCFVANNPMVGFNAYWGAANAETYFSSNYAGMIEFNQLVSGGFQFMTAPVGTAGNVATLTADMTIVNSGQVGIGTATPAATLQVTGSDFETGEFDNGTLNGTALTGTATGTGNSWGVLGETSSSGGDGLVASNYAASNTDIGDGLYASTFQSAGYGVYGANFNATAGAGVGVYGEGSGASGIAPALSPDNPGVYGEGIYMGVYGYADAASATVWPVYGANDGGVRWAALAEYFNSTDYKVVGSGTVSTIVNDNNNVGRIMNCPEAPEILFEDYGSGTLTNGRVHIDLDATYAKNITVNDKHVLRVLITLNDQCNGVYVTNRTATGFDVVELNNGTSNAAFTYEVIANRADSYAADGTLLSKNADNRFVVGPKPMLVGQTTQVNPMKAKPAAPAYVAAPRVNAQGSSSSSSLNQK